MQAAGEIAPLGDRAQRKCYWPHEEGENTSRTYQDHPSYHEAFDREVGIQPGVCSKDSSMSG